MSILSRWAGGVGAAALLILIPAILPTILIHLSTEILIFALFAVSFNLLWGYAGLLPFGHGAFFGLGAYTAGLLFNYFPGTPLLVAMICAALCGFLGGVVIGIFCVRLKGSYFALISLAFQMFLFAIAWKWRDLTRGDDGMGIVRPELYLPVVGKISMMSIQNLYYFTLVIVVLGLLAAYLFLKTHLGNSVLCMRENRGRASFLGYNVFLTDLTLFSFSGMLAAVAGALFVLFTEFMGTNSIDMNMSIIAVFMTMIGGAGHFLGPVLGAAFFIAFQDWISSLTDQWWLIMGVLFILVILYLNGGIVSLFQSRKRPTEENDENNTQVTESV